MSSPDSPGPSRTKPSKKATVDELREGLEQLGLDSKGKKETLFRRWVNFLSRSLYIDTAAVDTQPESIPPPISAKKWGKQPIRSFLCFDVEATCRGGREFDWPNEVIEFPVILCRWNDGWDGKPMTGDGSMKGSRLEQLDTFHTYVRPTWKPILTEFCSTLTGITQETVDKSPTFPEMLVDLEMWMRKWDLLTEDGSLNNAVWVSDGPWDLRDFVAKQLHISPPLPPTPAYPLYFLGPYLNIKQATQTYLSETWKREQYLLKHPYDPPNQRAQSRIATSKIVSKHDRENVNIPNFWFTITGQVEALGLGEFVGQQHSGIDDATNIARILIELGDQDVLIETNSRINQKKRWPWMGKPGEVNWEDWMSTVQPVNLPRSNAPVSEELKEKNAIIEVEKSSKSTDPESITGSSNGSEGTAVEKELGGSSLSTESAEGSPVLETRAVSAPILGPVVAVEKEEAK